MASGSSYDRVVEAELTSSIACMQLLHYDNQAPLDAIFETGDEHVIDISLTPRLPNARGRFPATSQSAAFERIGAIFFVPAGQQMNGRADIGRQTSLHCRLKANALEDWMDGERKWTTQALHACLSINTSEIHNGLCRIAAEMRQPGFASETMCELLGSQIAIDLARYCQALPTSRSAGGLAPWQLRLIKERLYEDSTLPTLTDLASLCGISNRHLSRAFRASCGISVGDYIEQCRIEKAKRLLTEGRAVKDIAHRMGFSSASSFSFAFRRSVGVTPRLFRQRTAGTLGRSRRLP